MNNGTVSDIARLVLVIIISNTIFDSDIDVIDAYEHNFQRSAVSVNRPNCCRGEISHRSLSVNEA